MDQASGPRVPPLLCRAAGPRGRPQAMAAQCVFLDHLVGGHGGAGMSVMVGPGAGRSGWRWSGWGDGPGPHPGLCPGAAHSRSCRCPEADPAQWLALTEAVRGPAHPRVGGATRNQRQGVGLYLEAEPLIEGHVLTPGGGEIARQTLRVGSGQPRPDEPAADAPTLRRWGDAHGLQVPVPIPRVQPLSVGAKTREPREGAGRRRHHRQHRRREPRLAPTTPGERSRRQPDGL
jgi:hypothetical protein